MPAKPSLDGLEEKWSHRWAESAVYAFDRSATRDQVYSIDTPPPTVSGSLHVGHVFSYTHPDIFARFWRMRGKAVFYPMWWDDNGLPTERRVQNHFGVRCDPWIPYDPDFQPPAAPGKQQLPISRRNFIELCLRQTEIDEKAFEELWRRTGLSVDWSTTDQTIGPRARALSQRAFLLGLQRGEAYQAEAPTLWDVTFRTAVAQAELEDRERPGAFHRIGFTADNGQKVFIETTRPELLPACVALVAHPSDERYQPLFGKTVRTPLFGVDVPVKAHHLADPAKGSGIAMVCTFGDTTDVVWWRELDLPMRTVFRPDGRFAAQAPAGVDSGAYEQLAGATAYTARERVVAMLRASGDLVGEPRTVTHAVKFYEKGDKPLEIITSRQWYIRNGGRDPQLRAALLARGRELQWHPPYMRARYENWVQGLAGDWLISRQRFFGVPIPVWYRLDEDGSPLRDELVLPPYDSLPVDPSSDVPPGFVEEQRGKPDGFIGDSDVMDTWATSSLSPQMVSGWVVDEDLFGRVFPMDLRPQAHEIIRTWLFSSVLRAHVEQGSLPWRHVALSGWILDPDRKKMSKSVGNATTPIGVLEQYGTDAIRYWAAKGRLGTDTAFDPAQMKIGRRLAIKILNASKFALSLGTAGEVTEPLDRALLHRLAGVVERVTQALTAYDYTQALESTEEFFWFFCDDYLELVKTRAYGSDAASGSAQATLTVTLSTLLRLFAPFLPFVTEEVWSWGQEGSVHVASWPDPDELRALAGAAEPAVLAAASTAIGAVRKAKSDRQVSMREPISVLAVTAPQDFLTALSPAVADLRSAGVISEVKLTVGDTPSFEVAL
ncbi:valine--tRNA ligase [Fodinicola feengrottensis]|uniref:Valine--tRNA ligase n=1 Tax=Fodinicola feengrottensis TaxID=435914 RepID=A0ABN2FZI8_9ACTN